jgi:hypothetical protein
MLNAVNHGEESLRGRRSRLSVKYASFLLSKFAAE